MTEIRGRDILREVKVRCEPLKGDFSGRKVTIVRFAPPPTETNINKLAKYEAARYSTDSKIKTFQFLGCEVESKLLPDRVTEKEFEAIIKTANEDFLTIGLIVQNPIPDRLIDAVSSLSPRKDLDGMQENHPLFKASATSETIARLVKSFADKNTVVAIVGARGFVGRGVVRLLEEDSIQCIGLDEGDDLLRTHEADIVVSATGVRELLDEQHLLPKHRLVVDAGFVPTTEGILGDVKRSAYNIPQYLTPVPGGVGPLQMATLLERLVSVTTGRQMRLWTYQDVNHEVQQIGEVSQSISSSLQQEALETAWAVQQVLNWLGQVQANGSVTFDSDSFHIAQSENTLTITSQADNRKILQAEGNQITYNPTLPDRQNLQILRERVREVLGQDQKQQRTQNWNL